ncbi:lytic transglycosylase domain-containing protein [Brumimicrobium aurantiacum]|uniref:Lytic transglycosylase domain-containing protein n=1 Tax=Brumimicrobium aurantiacum TaxID=1737063 RepID=A0A3E1F117_9FLAO|nr:lytic transglycosylase domain-containing protein [Brumimicrobium aurantiacum]RFC55521.1 lytic transglycosylase domain-containing protein [Brumimicrobium aurantiacum]
MKRTFLAFITLSFLLAACENEPVDVAKEPIKLTKENVENHFVLPKIPEQMTFAGQVISFKDLDLKERLDNELVVNNFWHSNTIMMMKRSSRWLPMMKRIFKEEGVPEDLVYISVIESGLKNVTSPRGAKGFWQFMEPTAKELGLTINHQMDERYHVEKSTRAACTYLKKSHERFDDWILAAASYNLGMFGIADNLERQGVNNFFDLSLNSETARYIFRMLAIKLVFENPNNYGFYLNEENYYPAYQTQEVVVDSTIANLYNWSIEQGITIKILRKLNPWIRGRDFIVEEGESFTFKIPENNEQLGRFEG